MILRSSDQAGEPPHALPDLLGRHRAERQPHEPVALYGTAVVGVGEERRSWGENKPTLLRAARQIFGVGVLRQHDAHEEAAVGDEGLDRKSTRLNSSHVAISYA